MNSGLGKGLNIAAHVEKVVAATPVEDIHTHLYDPAFGDLLLWGIDDLLVYHYLVAEAFRYSDIPYEKFWALPKTRQAELVWDSLFIQNSPISEACRGVLSTLSALGLDVKKRDLSSLRKWFAQWKVEDYLTRCMELGGVKSICMTNSPFDDVERPIWEKGFQRDERFTAALRIDPLLVSWAETVPRLAQWGYKAGGTLTEQTIKEVRRFLAEWTRKINARYMMVSLAPDFDFPSDTSCARLLEKAVLPECRELGIPMALMLGVKRQVNPGLRLAGDGVGVSKLSALEHLCQRHPENKFLVTVLSRENQHELCVLARKFRNLHIFGCWWFTNIPEIMDEMTRMRLELLGLSLTPQHSDARVLDQLIYKWQHSRKLITKVLQDKYADLMRTGWIVGKEEVERDVRNLFGGAFEAFCRR
ncbi:MAG TPA: hypothetical protein VMZ27_15120 [Candidatus Saccharimonadales bacterium]|nr:hypothetical protein [Candidatus Saccharimonadales bacterium]